MTKPPLVTLSIIGLIAMAPLVAGAADVQKSASSEITNRQNNVTRAKAAIAEGDKAFSDKHYDVAVVEYQSACDYLPEAPLTHALRAQAIVGFSQASVRLAEQRIAEGRYAEAETTVKTVLDEKYNPTFKDAIVLREHLDDPGYYNRTITPKFIDRIQQVKQYFIDADNFYSSGRYDLAYKRCDQVLDLDPTNIAARRMQEKINAARLKYAEEAYNATRSYLNQQIEQKWEIPPRQYLGHEIVRIESGPINVSSTQTINDKLRRISIPKIEFREATVADAISFLQKKSVELDTTEPDPARKGVNIVLKLQSAPGLGGGAGAPPVGGLPPGDAGALAPGGAAPAPAVSPSDAKITLSLANIPLGVALDYITKLANLKFKVEPYAVKIVPLSEPTDVLITKEYKVPPGFFSTSGAGGGVTSLGRPTGGIGGGAGGGLGGAGGPGTATASPDTPSTLPTRELALDFLKNAGVQFPPGASASFLPQSSKLVVRDTEENLDLVDEIVAASFEVQPTQVNIESKFVEIQQTNYKELSFDYSLGTGNIGNIEYSGGNTVAPSTVFPFTNVAGGGQITSGLRSGGEAINGNAVSALLNSTVVANTPSPATFALAGVVTTAQFQAVMRALNQKKGMDLLSAPNVTTKSGSRAVIEIIREFRYPTEFTAPQVPPIPAGGNAVGTFTPVTPTSPTAFETRNTGVTLEVEPVIGPDGQTIDLTLSPQVVEFDGFINYGSPIYGPPKDVTFTNPLPPFNFVTVPGTGPQTILTGNVINQPIFDTRKINTSVSVWDGATVIIGGLVREDVQTVEDKVPGLGDLPIIGRMFRSQVDQHIKRNLVMFVTARLVNPAGEFVHEDTEKEEDPAPATQTELAPAAPDLPEIPLDK